jgi:hypothetical protein
MNQQGFGKVCGRVCYYENCCQRLRKINDKNQRFPSCGLGSEGGTCDYAAGVGVTGQWHCAEQTAGGLRPDKRQAVGV